MHVVQTSKRSIAIVSPPRPSGCLSVCLSICDVDVPWALLGYLKTNLTNN